MSIRVNNYKYSDLLYPIMTNKIRKSVVRNKRPETTDEKKGFFIERTISKEVEIIEIPKITSYLNEEYSFTDYNIKKVNVPAYVFYCNPTTTNGEDGDGSKDHPWNSVVNALKIVEQIAYCLMDNCSNYYINLKVIGQISNLDFINGIGFNGYNKVIISDVYLKFETIPYNISVYLNNCILIKWNLDCSYTGFCEDDDGDLRRCSFYLGAGNASTIIIYKSTFNVSNNIGVNYINIFSNYCIDCICNNVRLDSVYAYNINFTYIINRDPNIDYTSNNYWPEYKFNEISFLNAYVVRDSTIFAEINSSMETHDREHTVKIQNNIDIDTGVLVDSNYTIKVYSKCSIYNNSTFVSDCGLSTIIRWWMSALRSKVTITIEESGNQYCYTEDEYVASGDIGIAASVYLFPYQIVSYSGFIIDSDITASYSLNYNYFNRPSSKLVLTEIFEKMCKESSMKIKNSNIFESYCKYSEISYDSDGEQIINYPCSC